MKIIMPLVLTLTSGNDFFFLLFLASTSDLDLGQAVYFFFEQVLVWVVNIYLEVVVQVCSYHLIVYNFC